ncbi:DUF2797 domain-containing protein [Streptomyces sp. AV19]|uniref:DUF2797 domain-containing protein n=1 Tax=Streptomyces sp. AV19 TaxID=2793068 RepID=UPI0018FE13B0|nr:DUF2797 domain-containing protein [Streptomyces sp. AV19]MBH1937143.1 DUF2797 domain-containing protein [Streptomyces sp. AV19]MDG4533170.1 DUF2797 domain-containing protein [Streptomyces sp. AV19]
MAWLCSGLRWSTEGPSVVWQHPLHGERLSPLAPGRRLGFVLGDARHCVGVRRGGRRTPCPTGAAVPSAAVSAQCAECARLDRSRSVAADTMADDPRPYDVYLAWFAPGLVKVGITAAERGGVRLLEQAALSYALLGRGPLMAARRAEAVLGVALGVPDRFPYAAKRAARHPLPPPDVRTAELAALHARACTAPGLPESLAVRAFAPVHHDEVFHVEGIRSRAGVAVPAAGRVVAGRVAAVAGPDVYLEMGDGRLVVVDVRRLAGWELGAVGDGVVTTVEVEWGEAPVGEPPALF